MPYETIAIEDRAKIPIKLYMKIETGGIDDLFADMIASSVAVVLRMLRIPRDTEPCKTRVRFKETKDSVTMIIRNHCLAVTPFGHLHLTGKKIAKKGKPYRAIYEIRLLREDQLSGETG
jgi:hypothetical protein